jgi:3alpha(or 20beta)-hydroxysteroid dehydrogenase
LAMENQSSDMFRVDNKVCLVTGAGRGIGASCAEVLSRAGATVMVTDILDDEGKAVAETITHSGRKAIFKHLDVTNEKEWIAVIEETIRLLGGLDVVVNNAGILGNNLVESISLDQWEEVMRINVRGVFLGTKHAILAMKPGGISGKGGSIINMASMCSNIALPNTSLYSASKGAVKMFTKVAAVECGQLKYGIRVNSVHPGIIRTAMLTDGVASQVALGLLPSFEEGVAMYHGLSPIGRLGETIDVANAVLYLASDASSFMTGSELIVDGGFSAP